MDTYNVIAVSFEHDHNAYEALTALKELDDQGGLRVEAALVVVRDSDGQIIEHDRGGSFDHVGTATGGLLGLMLGVIGGPLGVLIGGVSGLLLGSRFDQDEGDRTESVLGAIAETVRPDHTALLAQLTEPGPELVDTTMTRLGGTVLRRPVADVEAGIAAAEKARYDAKREATKEQVHTETEALKVKLPRREKGETAGT